MLACQQLMHLPAMGKVWQFLCRVIWPEPGPSKEACSPDCCPFAWFGVHCFTVFVTVARVNISLCWSSLLIGNYLYGFQMPLHMFCGVLDELLHHTFERVCNILSIIND